MLPHVTLHNAVSLDGRLNGFPIDLGLYYGLTQHLPAEAILAGSTTARSGYQRFGLTPDDEQALPPPSPATDDPRPLLAVVDSRGTIDNWDQIRREPYWRDALALISRATPAACRERLRRRRVGMVESGEENVDLRTALAVLHDQYGVRRVRVDAGGGLNGALLRAGLVNEISVLLCPVVVDDPRQPALFAPAAPAETARPLELFHCERLADGTVWLRYRVSAAG